MNSKIDWDRYEDYILAPDGLALTVICVFLINRGSFRSTVRTLNYADEDILLGPKDIQVPLSWIIPAH